MDEGAVLKCRHHCNRGWFAVNIVKTGKCYTHDTVVPAFQCDAPLTYIE